MTKAEKEEQSSSKTSLFDFMANTPVLFLFAVPIIFCILLSFGWTRDDLVEDQVSEIWVPKGNSLAEKTRYLDEIGVQAFTSTSAAAIAVSRDGKNIYTESRLEEIRARMEAVESITVDYDGGIYTWEDVCSSNNLGGGTCTSYRWPCIRLSGMDHFQEARWYFDEVDKLTWYGGILDAAAIRPRILRFGILQQSCVPTTSNPEAVACAAEARLRSDAEFAVSQGYPASYANPLGLIGDVGDLEFNTPCRMCIEGGLEAAMQNLIALVQGMFTVLQYEFGRSAGLVESAEAQVALGELAGKAQKIAASVNRKQVEDFFYYQVIRGTYAELGASSYLHGYMGAAQYCPPSVPGLVCPSVNVTVDDAKLALLRHADNTFSSITTAGSPLPFWSEADGSGNMFAGSSPVGGSGIDMSAPIGSLSAAAYLDMSNYGTDEWAPLYNAGVGLNPLEPSAEWTSMVETNPVYAWFMAGETDMTAHCGNGKLKGTNVGSPELDGGTAQVAFAVSSEWCTKYRQPFETDGTFTKQHFARMWYDYLFDDLVGVELGKDDPYTFTLGSGCGYSLAGERFSYTNKTDAQILGNASGELYYIDEGVSVGVIDSNLFIGGANPPVGEYSVTKPLEEVKLLQSIYPTIGVPSNLVKRLKSPHRPSGAVDITEVDAEEILRLFKESFDSTWSEGWDDSDAGEVQFVSFYDDTGAPGTSSRFLEEITLSNGTLTVVSILIIAFFSVIFLFSFDPVDSMVGITLVGIALVILSFFAANGLAFLFGIKLNVSVAWTLPFIILGLGVDDMYIVLLALKKERGCSKENFLNAMTEVVGPVTMTSLVNASMFAIMNISDIPAVYITAQVALIAVIFLYIAVILCFPAYCYLDMQRQASNKRDIFVWMEVNRDNTDEHRESMSFGVSIIAWFYDNVFAPTVLGPAPTRYITHFIIWAIAGALFIVGIVGTTEREVGLGLEDFFPVTNQAQRWATLRTEYLASWSININWAELDYGDPDVQMRMIKQFEDVISSPYVAEVDTKQLWIADFNIWTSSHCDSDVSRSQADRPQCGMSQVFPVDNSTCSGTWKPNELNLKQKNFPDPTSGVCEPYEGGICRPSSQMHPMDLALLDVTVDSDVVWCPVFEGWSDEKLGFCLQKWRLLTGGGGSLMVDEEQGSPAGCPTDPTDNLNDETVTIPIKYSKGPNMFAINLVSHDDTVNMIEETTKYCDYDEALQGCWLSGIPYSYWSQYIGVFDALIETSSFAVAFGFVVAVCVLFLMLHFEGHHSTGKNLTGALVGSFLIAVTTVLSLTATVGLSVLWDVNMTAFSVISFVLSVGFSVEYSVHVVSRWLLADNDLKSSCERVDYTMSFLMLPTFMSFVSSTIGVACLAFTEFEFTQVYFFRPLLVVMLVTYFYGCWWLPACLTGLCFESLRLGKPEGVADPEEKNIDDSGFPSEISG